MARGERGGGEALGGFSARESTSTNYLRQWAVQVRRRARPATSLHRVAGRTPVRGSTVAGMGKRRRTALRRRARFPLAPGLRHCSRSAHLWQSSRAARKTARCVKAFSCRNSALPECRSCRTAQRSKALPPIWPRPPPLAHCQSPYVSGISLAASKRGGRALDGAHSISRSSSPCIA